MSRRIPEEGSLSRIAGLSPEQRRLDWRVKRQIEKLDAVPTRMSKMLGWAGWGSAILGWMSLYEDFGQQDNVFTDLRKRYKTFMKETFNLSPQEKSLLNFTKTRPVAFEKLDEDLRTMGKDSAFVQAIKQDIRDDTKANPT